MTDYHLRLSEVFRVHSGLNPPANNDDSPYEQQLKASLVEGLLPEIRHYVTKHCIHVDSGRIADVLAHARHTERTLRQAGDKVAKTKEKLGEKLQLAQLQVYEQQTYRGRGRGSSRGRGRKRRTYKQDGCFRCGSLTHWAQDCTQSEPEQDREDWLYSK